MRVPVINETFSKFSVKRQFAAKTLVQLKDESKVLLKTNFERTLQKKVCYFFIPESIT